MSIRRLSALLVVSVTLVWTAAATAQRAPRSRQPVPSSTTATPPGVINAMGVADLEVDVDDVVIVFGLESSDANLRQAQARIDALAAGLIEVARKYKIKDPQIKPDFLQVRPLHTDGAVTGYDVRKDIRFTLHDADQFESFLLDGLEAGATHIRDVRFLARESRRHQERAREAALEDAERKARGMADKLGLSLGRPLSVTQREDCWVCGAYGAYLPFTGPTAEGRMTAESTWDFTGGEYDDDPIDPGHVVYSARVAVSYQLE